MLYSVGPVGNIYDLVQITDVNFDNLFLALVKWGFFNEWNMWSIYKRAVGNLAPSGQPATAELEVRASYQGHATALEELSVCIIRVLPDANYFDKYAVWFGDISFF